jgi:hypothetical protein
MLGAQARTYFDFKRDTLQYSFPTIVLAGSMPSLAPPKIKSINYEHLNTVTDEKKVDWDIKECASRSESSARDTSNALTWWLYRTCSEPIVNAATCV